MRHLSSHRSASPGFTLLELLVGAAVLVLMLASLLQLTSALSASATRTNETLKLDSEVRAAFDLMRRDLLQARIGKRHNTFHGGTDRMFFVSSTPRLAQDFVSDQRQLVYFVEDGAMWRTVVDPSLASWRSGLWNPMDPEWHLRTGLAEPDNSMITEKIIDGVLPYSGGQNSRQEPWFSYRSRESGALIPLAPGNFTDSANPPAGVLVAFDIVLPSARRSGVVTDANTRSYRYDIELNLPPVFNP